MICRSWSGSKLFAKRKVAYSKERVKSTLVVKDDCNIMRGSRGGQGVRNPPPEKSQKYRFSSNTGPVPLKIQCWAINGTPAFRWRAHSGIWILIKNEIKKTNSFRNKKGFSDGIPFF